MERKFSIFILIMVSLVVCAVKLIDFASGNVKAARFNQSVIGASSIVSYESSIDTDVADETPFNPALHAHIKNIHSGYARTISRCSLLMHRYGPSGAFLKNGEIFNLAQHQNYSNSRGIMKSVELSANHGFIRLCKLLI